MEFLKLLGALGPILGPKNQARLVVAVDGPPWTLTALPLPMRCVSRRPDQWQRTRPSTSANVRCSAARSFSHLLIRNTKDGAPCFSSKKGSSRLSVEDGLDLKEEIR